MGFLGLNGNQKTPAEKQLRPILFDESIQVLSNFELNQVASLTYNDLTCDGIFELIEGICNSPLDHTCLTIQKALIVTKHVVVYGSENTVNHAYAIQHLVHPLQEFNTVLMAHKKGGPRGFFQNLQGGGVDRGGPVREAAVEVVKLLSNIDELRKIRVASASQDSLVPVGDNGVAFVTDEVRLHVLKRRIETENQLRIQSNLKKSEGGFGAGYTSKDGKNVVGAAHGIEEMIKMASLQTKKFSDDGRSGKSREQLILEELKAEADAEKAARDAEAAARAAPPVDLLGFSSDPASQQGTADLLSFDAPPAGAAGGAAGTAAGTADLLGGGLVAGTPPAAAPSDDPFGLASAYTGTAAPAPSTGNLLDAAAQHDPFAAVPAVPTTRDSMNLISMNTNLDIMDQAGRDGSTPMVSVTPAPIQVLGSGSAAPAMNGLSAMQMPGLDATGLSTMQMLGPDTTGLSTMQMLGPDTTGLPAMNGLTSAVASVSLSEPAPEKSPVMESSGDRFSALDALAESSVGQAQATALDAKKAEDRLLGFASASSTGPGSGLSAPSLMGMPPPVPEPMGGSVPPVSMGMPPPPPVPEPMGGMGMPMGMPPPPPVPEPMMAPGSGSVANSYGGAAEPGDDDNPWVMGGSAGMGLEPKGPEPSAPPPPPPPDF
ncbi:unnamed protein product [Pseudo-nitzschia multistriata]|uniref:ENTH domain-containing protein n=1 Tax=Pseudo-nitzschia multistriata TaxID=183589 RepID=A0A448ZKR3_9STRA|nr:unnamed protein product [Pseudo-nitzschia multistriata]